MIRPTLLSLVAACSAVLADSPVTAPEEARFITNARQLILEGKRSGEGYFSPDGKKLIFQSEREAGNPFYQIYVLDLETGDTNRVSPGQGKTTCAFFQPGSDRVIFASTHEDPQSLARQKAEIEFRESGKQRRYAWDYDPQMEIYSATVDGKDIKPLTRTPGYDAEGSVSPDGKQIVFCSLRSVFPMAELTPEQKKQFDANPADLVPAAERARFEKDPAYYGEIYLMNVDGSNVRRLTSEPGYDGGPFFTPDGQRIVWRHFDESGMFADVWTMKLDGSDKQRLTDFKSMSWAPYFHPSGKYLIFTSNKLGFENFELFIVDAEGKKEPVRVSFTTGFDGLPVFSPDGGKLAWATGRTSDGKSQLFYSDWNHAAALEALEKAPARGANVQPVKTADAPSATATPEVKAAPGVAGLQAGITVDDLKMQTGYLASATLEGRGTGSAGAEQAAKWIGEYFQAVGLKTLPGQEGYFVPFQFNAGERIIPDQNTLASVLLPEGDPHGAHDPHGAVDPHAAPAPVKAGEPAKTKTPKAESANPHAADPHTADAHEAPAPAVKTPVVKPGAVNPHAADPHAIDPHAAAHDPHGAAGVGAIAIDWSKMPGAINWKLDTDFRPLAFSENGKVSGEVVFAGYGLSLPEAPGQQRYNSYEGLDVKDKIVLMLRYVPEGVDAPRRAHLNRYAGIRYKVMMARERGAKGVLLVTGPNSPNAGELIGLNSDGSSAGSGIVAASISAKAADQLLASTGKTLKEVQTALDDENPHALVPSALPRLRISLQAGVEHIKKSDRNVVAYLPRGVNEGPEEWVLLGAHYDHLGRGSQSGSSLAKGDEQSKIHYGADDNASGTALVMEAAAALAAERAKHPEKFRRNIAFCLWSGEEMGLLGSASFAEKSPIDLTKVAAYVNADMVGRLRDNKLLVQGVGSSKAWPRIVEKRNVAAGFALTLQEDPYLPTDVTSFYPKRIPVLNFFTGSHEDYHRPTDTADKLNLGGLERVTKFATGIVQEVAQAPERIDFSRIERKETGGSRDNLRAYLGSIPDYAQEVKGVKLSGVRSGSPAEKAGVQGGDVVVEFAGQKILNIYDYTAALDSVKIGQPVKIVVERAGQRVEITATPEARK